MSRNNPGTDDFVPASERFPKREVLEFWGKPSAGFFRKVAVVQDSVVVEPTKDFAKQVQQAADAYAQIKVMPCKTPEDRAAIEAVCKKANDIIEIDYDEAERRVAAAMLERPKVKVKRTRAFPNDGTLCGNYGMWRTPGEHRTAVKRCLKVLTPIADTFDVIYCTGFSGTIPAATVAYLLNKPLLMVRKYDDKGLTHSHGTVLEGPTDKGLRYMIVDDFVSGGGTLRRLYKHAPGRIVGIMLYGHPRGSQEKEQGYAKLFATYPDGDYKPCQWWYLLRRSPTSMLFDLHPVEAK